MSLLRQVRPVNKGVGPRSEDSPGGPISGGLAGPDGLALNEEDGLAIAHAGYGVVWICNRLGDPVIAIRSPEGIYTTNVAYGGADRRDLYITESYGATILRARVDVPGRQMFSHL